MRSVEEYLLDGIKSIIQINSLTPDLSGDSAKEIQIIAHHAYKYIGKYKLLRENRGIISTTGSAYFNSGDDYLDKKIPHYYYNYSKGKEAEILNSLYLMNIYAKFVWQLNAPITKMSFRNKNNKFVFEVHSNIENQSFDINMIKGNGECVDNISLELMPKIVKEIEGYFFSYLEDYKNLNPYVISPINDFISEVHITSPEMIEKLFSNSIKITKFSEKILESLTHIEIDKNLLERLNKIFLLTHKLEFHATAYLLYTYSKITRLYYCYLLPSFFIEFNQKHMSFGTMVFDITRQLSIEEINILRLLNSDKWKSINTIQINRLSKDAEWKVIVDEMSHSMKHQLGALQYRGGEKNKAFNRLIRDIKKEGGTYDNRTVEDYEKQSKKTASINRQLADVNDVLFALMKIGNENTSDNDLSEDVKATLKIEQFDLVDLLEDCLDVLHASLDLIGFKEEEHSNKIEKFVIPELLQSIKDNLSGYQLFATRKLLSIVILDLLKNSIRFTEADNPKVNIDFKIHDDNHYSLHFTNNQKMSNAAYDFILNDIDAVNWSKSSKVGIRTIKKILEYKEIGHSKNLWRLRVNVYSISENYTDIFIVIPKQDVKYEITKQN